MDSSKTVKVSLSLESIINPQLSRPIIDENGVSKRGENLIKDHDKGIDSLSEKVVNFLESDKVEASPQQPQPLRRAATVSRKKLNVSKRSGLVSYTQLKAAQCPPLAMPQTTKGAMSQSTVQMQTMLGVSVLNRIPTLSPRGKVPPKSLTDSSNGPPKFPTFYPLIVNKTSSLLNRKAPQPGQSSTSSCSTPVESKWNKVLAHTRLESAKESIKKPEFDLTMEKCDKSQDVILALPRKITSSYQRPNQPEIAFPFYPASGEQVEAVITNVDACYKVKHKHKLAINLKSHVAAVKRMSLDKFKHNGPHSLLKDYKLNTFGRTGDDSIAYELPSEGSIWKGAKVKGILFTMLRRGKNSKKDALTNNGLPEMSGVTDVQGTNGRNGQPAEKGVEERGIQISVPIPGTVVSTSNEHKNKAKQDVDTKCLDLLTHFLFSHVGVLLVLFLYTIIGALIFQAIEGPQEDVMVKEVVRQRKLTALDLSVQIKVTGLDYLDLEHTIERELKRFQDKIILFVESGFDGHEDTSMSKWSYAGALLYCITVITTIGYGNIAPLTNWGRIFTVFYALIGIPLLVLFLSNIGAVMALAFKWLCKRISLISHATCKKCKKSPSTFAQQNGGSQNKLEELHTLIIKDPMLRKGLVENSDVELDKVTRELAARLSATLGNIPENSQPQFVDHIANAKTAENEMVSDKLSNNNRGDSQSGQETIIVDEINPIASSYKDFQVPVWACLSLLFGYLILGSLSFSVWEQWNIITSFYFCFITLSTIGFGDVVPGSDLFSPSSIEKFVFVTMYIIFGMALMSMCLNLMQQTIIKNLKIWGNKLGFL